ncbi:MAG: hypothetical protein ACRDZ5_03935 [Acidimicrobiales bacterium]
MSVAGLAQDHISGVTRTQVLAGERLLPLSPALSPLVPAGGLQRGTTARVTGIRPGTTSLALELLVGVSMSGSWCAIAGMPELGLRAVEERGFDLSHLLLVPSLGDPSRRLQVLAALLDAVDAVVLAPPATFRPGDTRRIMARARERCCLLVVVDRLGTWPVQVDLSFAVAGSRWSGLGPGHGLLRERRLEVEVRGRGAAALGRRGAVALPA